MERSNYAIENIRTTYTWGAQTILTNLPERIRLAFIDRAAEINFPVEAVIEMALAGYLDSESIRFVDCTPDRGRG
jgi:hypothetical protein